MSNFDELDEQTFDDEYQFDESWITDEMAREVVEAKAAGTFASIVRARQGEEIAPFLTRKQTQRWAEEARSMRIDVMNAIIERAVRDEVARH